MNKNEFALTIYPVWKAEEMCENFIEETDDEAKKELYCSIADICSDLYEEILEAEEKTVQEKRKMYRTKMVCAMETIFCACSSLNCYEELADVVQNLKKVFDEIKEACDRYCTFSLM